MAHRGVTNLLALVIYPLPRLDLRHLEQLFRHRVLKMLQREGRIDEALIRKVLGWRHSGFSVHNAVRIGGQDSAGRRAAAEYILRSPFSQQKMRYHAKSRTMIYPSKIRPVLKRNFEVFPVLDWLAALTAHIPNPGEHVVRYSGWYSNLSRGKRKKTQAGGSEVAATEMAEVPPPAISQALKRRWAHFIKQVYEADALLCPKCQPECPCFS
jgi:hypothetical protein